MAAVGRNVVVVDLEGRERISTSHPLSEPSSASFSADGDALAVKATNGHIVVVNPETGVVICNHRNKREGEGGNIACSQDGEHLVDGSWAGAFTIRHMLTGQILVRDEFRGQMIGRITHDEHRRTWVVEHQPKAQSGENMPPPGYISVVQWPFSSLRGAKVVRFGCYLDAPSVSPDGTRICFRDRHQNELLVARLDDGQILARARLEIGGTGSDLAWSSNGSVIGAVASDGFAFFSGNDLALLGRRAAKYPSSVLFHPNGHDVLLGTWDRSSVEKIGVVCNR
jgi:hypothetical protein